MRLFKAHSFFRRSLILIATLAFSGCGGSERELKSFPAPLPVIDSIDLSAHLPALVGKRVSEFTLLIFASELNRDQWKNVFLQTGELSRLRMDIQRAKTRSLSVEEQARFDAKVIRAGMLLGELYDSSAVYLFNWGETENCEIDPQVRLKCDPLYDIYGPNPLSGGNPEAINSISIVQNEDEKSSSLKFDLRNTSPELGDFQLTLALKPQRADGVVYFKGDVEVLPGSFFIKDGDSRLPFRYGYAELRFSN